ncbi:MAG: response regulator [Tabrizicola sp.]|nr:response regulator [Tabrizicola sp.]
MILDFPEKTGTVMVDPVRLETAILNMALNSRDAMPDGGRFAIEMRIVEVDADFMAVELAMTAGRYLVISVSDTGTGMSLDVKRRAFEPFFSTKPSGQGSGLGLPMVYGFARQSGGHVAIYSEVGLGTTINLYLPEYTAAPVGMAPAPVTRPASLLQFDAHVLLVEDDARVRTISTVRLQNLGCQVTEAANADEAVRLLRRGVAFDLVFTDLAMPGPMSGLDLCDHVREHYPGLPVLLTSGYAEDVVHADRMRLNDITLLRKPYRISELSAQIGLLLSETSTSGAKR